MQARRAGAGWSWLMGGFGVARQHPGRILGAAVLLALCFVLTATTDLVARTGGAAFLAVAGVLAVISGLVSPILYGGFMRVLDATRNGRPASALGVFEPFRPGHGGLRLLLFGLCMLIVYAVYAVFFAIVLTTVGRSVGPWYLHTLAQHASGTAALAAAPLPPGFGVTVALALVFCLFYGGALAIGTGQVALRGRSPWNGFLDGVAGAFKNVLPLVVLALCGLVALIIVSVLLGVIIAILMLVGHFAGATVGLGLIGLLYVVFALAVVAFVMGVNYAIWRDVAGDTPSRALDAPVAGAQG
ncbi:MAG TPA: hypothetical protein VF292_14345 [Rhodanobacteraceae bacterium]